MYAWPTASRVTSFRIECTSPPTHSHTHSLSHTHTFLQVALSRGAARAACCARLLLDKSDTFVLVQQVKPDTLVLVKQVNCFLPAVARVGSSSLPLSSPAEPAHEPPAQPLCRRSKTPQRIAGLLVRQAARQDTSK